MISYSCTARVLSFFLLMTAVFSSTAFAETVQGRVAKTASSAIHVTVFDAQGRPYPNALNLRLDSRTKLNGYSSRSSIRVNDPVSVNVSQESSGAWRADSLVRLSETAPIKQQAAPSPSLAGALREPVVRNALLGAATGAIAAKASGGKAGKGALYGAGAGVAAGILGDLLSPKQQPQQQPVYVDTDDRSRY